MKRGGELRRKFADPDATWGHRSSISTRSGGGYYGYKVHCCVDIVTGLPAAWQVETAKDSEIPQVEALLNAANGRGFAPSIAILDRGHDTESLYSLLEGRDIRPVIPVRKTPAVKAGKHLPRPATTVSGRSPGQTPSRARPSGVAPQVSVRPLPRGSRRTASTP